ncbi:4-alpha-glucanotransferase [Treponema vincentii]|uniref:4-alpha-glucanotransferase n=1 Tax=Treponema vincentii TaxID=69710 RepID=UPI0035F55C61
MSQTLFNRSAGILLHPTSLPSDEGIGTFGRTAYGFIDWLAAAHIRIWQVLPFGPTGYGDSPYASFSSFAGNPLLIDLKILSEQGYLTSDDIKLPSYLSTEGSIDFGSVVYWKLPLLKKAASAFLGKIKKGDAPDAAELEEAYRRCKRRKHLGEYALFMSIKEVYDAKAAQEGLSGKLWNNYWPKALACRDPETLKRWGQEHRHEIELYTVIQYFFFEQWQKLHRYANEKGISIIGDIPIFVAPDSADVWANQKFFQLDENGIPTVVAGVPPDYFSATGQLWGNPLYNWDAMKADKYRWWIDRIEAGLDFFDYIRIDHFRGFESYWAVPFGASTAEKGAWLPGPDHHFFEALQRALIKKNSEYAEGLPIIAEDLGIITPPVERLRDDFHLPGMKVLQFAFNAAEVREAGFTNAFLPHRYTQNAVVYTGTHDNTTLRAWLDTLSRDDFEVLLFYLYGERPAAELLDELFSTDGTAVQCNTPATGQPADEGTVLQAAAFKDDLCAELIKQAFFSVAVFAVIPFQDLYALGAEARMNEPSTLGKNWTWRMPRGLLTPECAEWLGDLVIASGRWDAYSFSK